MRKISKRLQKAMGLSNIVSLAASPIVARKRVSDSPFVSKKVMTNTLITLLIRKINFQIESDEILVTP